jgi:hypothetical protein
MLSYLYFFIFQAKQAKPVFNPVNMSHVSSVTPVALPVALTSSHPLSQSVHRGVF